MLDSEMKPYHGAIVTVDISASVMKRIYDILLLEVLDVKVSYSDDELEMAKAVISGMKEKVAQVLNLMLEHCLMLRLREKENDDA